MTIIDLLLSIFIFSITLGSISFIASLIGSFVKRGYRLLKFRSDINKELFKLVYPKKEIIYKSFKFGLIVASIFFAFLFFENLRCMNAIIKNKINYMDYCSRSGE